MLMHKKEIDIRKNIYVKQWQIAYCSAEYIEMGQMNMKSHKRAHLSIVTMCVLAV